MRVFYRNALIIIFLSIALPNIYAMSKPYRTYASVILINNRPCVYVVGSNGGEYTQGINLYDDSGIIWKNKTIPAAASKDSCVALSDPDYVFRTNTMYAVELGWGYAYTGFCLMRDEMNHLFLSKVAVGGSSCTTEPHQNPEDKSRWQRLKEWW